MQSGSPGQGAQKRKPLRNVRLFCVYKLLAILYSAKTNQIDEFWRIIKIFNSIN
jgi:hypothetical protein